MATSGVGVIDKAAELVAAIEAGPCRLADLVARTDMSRATAHRLAAALEIHGWIDRDPSGRYVLGPELARLGRSAAEATPLADRARPAMVQLRDATGESVQLYVRRADSRVCIAALESLHELRTIVPVGAVLPLDRGSAGHVLMGQRGVSGGWTATVAERAPGVASVSAPVQDVTGEVVAAVGVSGPIERTGRQPGRRYGPDVVAAAEAISRTLT